MRLEWGPGRVACLHVQAWRPVRPNRVMHLAFIRGRARLVQSSREI